MVGILVATHGKFAEGILDATHLIMGAQEQFDFVGLFEGNDFDEFTATVENKIKNLDKGQGVLVFVDLFGASPYNAGALAAQKLKDTTKVRLVSGVNLPMLLETLSSRDMVEDIEQLYKSAMDAAKKGVQEFFESLG